MAGNVTKFPPRGRKGNFHVERDGDHVAISLKMPWLREKPVEVKISGEHARAIGERLIEYANAIRIDAHSAKARADLERAQRPPAEEDRHVRSVALMYGAHCGKACAKSRADRCDVICSCGNVWRADGSVTLRLKGR